MADGKCLQVCWCLYTGILFYTVSESTREELTGAAANRRAAIYRKSQEYSG